MRDHEDAGEDLRPRRQELDNPLQAENDERSSDPQGQTEEARLGLMSILAGGRGFGLSFARPLGE